MKDDGGPAFPQRGEESNFGRGMSLRDYFAAAVLQGTYACSSVTASDEQLVKNAYAVSDLMLAEREKSAK